MTSVNSYFSTGEQTLASGLGTSIQYSDQVVFVFSVFLTIWWSIQAFDRKSIKFAGIPTFPRYMTRRSQYHLGQALF